MRRVDLSLSTRSNLACERAPALADDEIERRQLSKALLPHVRHFYAGRFDPETHLPYYRPRSRIF